MSNRIARSAGAAILLELMVGHCAAGAAKLPLFTAETEKSLESLAGCIVVQLAESRGYEIAKSDVPSGAEIRMKFRVAGIAATAATFRIEDLTTTRRLTIYATGKESGAPKMIASRTRACL